MLFIYSCYFQTLAFICYDGTFSLVRVFTYSIPVLWKYICIVYINWIIYLYHSIQVNSFIHLIYINSYIKLRMNAYDKYKKMDIVKSVIPKKLRQQSVALAHQGHLGIVGTKQRLRIKVWWPQMKKEVERYVKSCHGYQITSAMPSPEPISTTPLPSGPWQTIAIDLLGPLPSKDYNFVVVDYYSRYYEIGIMKDTSSESIIASLEKMFLQHIADVWRLSHQESIGGLPLYIQLRKGRLSDRISQTWKGFASPKQKKKDWKREVREYMFRLYRTTPQSVTGVAPAEMMFQRKLRTRLLEMEKNNEVGWRSPR